MKKIFFVCFIVIISLSVYSDEKIIMLVNPDNQANLYSFTDSGGNPCGFIVELLESAAAEYGIDVSYKSLPRVRGERAFANGIIDAYPGAVKFLENPDQYIWSDVIWVNKDVLFSKSDNPIEF